MDGEFCCCIVVAEVVLVLEWELACCDDCC
jgi:hypothetical protein